MKEQSVNTSTHDIGFIINSSYGQGFRLTKEESYKKVLTTAATSLASRYNDNIGCIKSLDGLRGYNFPVLIDNMVNLEILFKSWRWNNNEEFYKIVVFSKTVKIIRNTSTRETVKYFTSVGFEACIPSKPERGVGR